MTKVTKPMSEDALNWAHAFLHRTARPRMSDEKIDRMIREHFAGRKNEPRVPVEYKRKEEAV